MAQTLVTDVAIIGAGPAGLFAVFECGMLKMRCVVIDTLEAIGGQCSALYPEKPIFDIPAHPRIEAATLIHQLEAQAAPFQPTYLLGRRVEGLRALGDDFILTTSAGDSVAARAVIIAPVFHLACDHQAVPAAAGRAGPDLPTVPGDAGAVGA